MYFVDNSLKLIRQPLLICILFLLPSWTLLHANATPPPPAALERVVNLVGEGKFDDAKVAVETLLILYPDDPQLTRIYAIIQQRLKQPPTAPSPPVLSNADRLEINTLVSAVNQAFQIKDTAQRHQRLQSALARPVPDNAKNTAWLPYWQARALAAMDLGNYVEGWQAGNALIQLGALDSQDGSLNQIMVNLNTRGWLLESPEAIRKAAEDRYKDWLGIWKGKWQRHSGPGRETISNTITLEVEFSLDAKSDIQAFVKIHHNDYKSWMDSRGRSDTFQRNTWITIPGGIMSQHQQNLDPAVIHRGSTCVLREFNLMELEKKVEISFGYVAHDNSTHMGKLIITAAGDANKATIVSIVPHWQSWLPNSMELTRN
jgi:hypothetical protein